MQPQVEARLHRDQAGRAAAEAKGGNSLCTSGHQQPAGRVPVDGYKLALQNNNFAPGSAKWTLHGLRPESVRGFHDKDRPYGCQNGEEFDERILTTFDGLLDYFRCPASSCPSG